MRDKFYDGEHLFRTYCGWGRAATNNMLIRYAENQYGKSSQMGPNYAMWNWAFKNPETAYELWKEWYFQSYPEKDQPTFDDFLLILKRKGSNNPNITSKSGFARFCAKYELQFESKVNADDVIQVTRKDHHLFQNVLIVDRVDGADVIAFSISPDGNRTTHELSVKEIGVIGKAIV